MKAQRQILRAVVFLLTPRGWRCARRLALASSFAARPIRATSLFWASRNRSETCLALLQSAGKRGIPFACTEWRSKKETFSGKPHRHQRRKVPSLLLHPKVSHAYPEQNLFHTVRPDLWVSEWAAHQVELHVLLLEAAYEAIVVFLLHCPFDYQRAELKN